MVVLWLINKYNLQAEIMKKIIAQGTITILLFLGMWFSFELIDWKNLLKVQKVTDETEQKLGEIIWEVFSITENENNNRYLINSVDSIISHICISNKISRNKIKVHILLLTSILLITINQKNQMKKIH